jgi:hypothetical protein
MCGGCSASEIPGPAPTRWTLGAHPSLQPWLELGTGRTQPRAVPPALASVPPALASAPGCPENSANLGRTREKTLQSNIKRRGGVGGSGGSALPADLHVMCGGCALAQEKSARIYDRVTPIRWDFVTGQDLV